ncbi:MAG: type II toxin-antitoxin system RelE/ParE family toxin [Saprospiraceae bacterium]
MKITFKSRKLEKQLTNPKEMVKAFGDLARKVSQRIMDLEGAENLETLRYLPAARCHELSGNRKGQIAVNISTNFRLIFEPDHDPPPQKDDGGLNWSEVTKIRINEIKDYH